MMNRSIHSHFDRHPLMKPLVGVVSLLGIVTSVAMTDLVHAQTPAEMTQYTKIAQQIERQRLQEYAKVRGLMGGNVPENVCQQGNLPQPVRDICADFDATSRDIITRNGMTIPKFNEITRFCQQSPKPKECPK